MGMDMLEEGFIGIGCESVFRRETMPAEHGRSLEVATPLHPPRKGSTEKTSSPCQIHQRTEATGHPAACPPTTPRPVLERQRGRDRESQLTETEGKPTSVQTCPRANISRGDTLQNSPHALGQREHGRRHVELCQSTSPPS